MSVGECLDRLVAADKFLPSLFLRLSQLEIHLPPLRHALRERLAVRYIDRAGNRDDYTYGALLRRTNQCANALRAALRAAGEREHLGSRMDQHGR